MIQIDKLLATAIKREAEDIVLTVGRPPLLRLNGALEPLATPTSGSASRTRRPSAWAPSASRAT